MTEVVDPGTYDLPVEDYHRHRALSSSGARKLLPPSCPAKFRYEQDHPTPSTRAQELGTAAHARVLGIGPEIVVVDAKDWRTNLAKSAASEARERGAVPLLTHENKQVEDMAAALRADPIASALLDPDHGRAEPSLFWRDLDTGVMRRARFDWLREPDANGRLIIPDYKTSKSADPDKFARSAYDYGYYCQADWYVEGARALRYAEDVAFVFIVQEKEPPYLVTVCEPDGLAMRHGRGLNEQALAVYAACLRTNLWPAYAEDVAVLSLPPWLENQYLRELSA